MAATESKAPVFVPAAPATGSTVMRPSSPTPAVSVANPATFPPSPPSSCGDESPPPKSPEQVCRQRVVSPVPGIVQKPKVSPPPKPILTFSIENILRPDFGNESRIQERTAGEAVLRTPPKTPEISPVDLSHKPPTGQKSSISEEEKRKPPTESKSTNTVNLATTNSRVRYPENPEELANPKVPQDEMIWPAWVYCTRYSDRPSSGPRSRRIKRRDRNPEEKRPRTAFTSEQLARLKHEFDTNKYLDDKRRQSLARELNLNESQIKIWFQNKRAKDKKNNNGKNTLAQHLIAQGLYNHTTMPLDEDDPLLS